MINWDFVNGVGDHIATLEKVNSAMNDEITRLRTEVERLTNKANEAEKWKGIARAKGHDQIIERCAEVCLAQRNMRVERHPPRFEVTVDTANIMAEKCAAAIRAMKG
jgi:hypothetical protein